MVFGRQLLEFNHDNDSLVIHKIMFITQVITILEFGFNVQHQYRSYSLWLVDETKYFEEKTHLRHFRAVNSE